MPETNNNNKFDSPYRTTIRIPWKTVGRLKQIHPQTGIYQLIADELFNKLINSLELYGFKDFDPAGLEHFLKKCSITDGRGTVSNTRDGSSDAIIPPKPESVDGNDKRRTRKVARKT